MLNRIPNPAKAFTAGALAVTLATTASIMVWLQAVPLHAQDATNTGATPSRVLQPQDKIIPQMVVYLLERQHYSRTKIDDAVSRDLFKEYFDNLDRNRYYFLASDIEAFAPYRDQLDNQLRRGDMSFAFAVFDLFLRRIKDRVNFVRDRVHDPQDFTVGESMHIDRTELPWPESVADLDEAWRKNLKNQFLTELLAEEERRAEEAAKPEADERDDEDEDDVRRKKVTEEGMTPEERVVKRYENYYNYFSAHDSADIIETYLSTLAGVLDPHSSYMNWRSKEDFDIHMKLSLQGIGATLTQENGYTKIVSLVPGGPAERDGRLKPGDLITAVAAGRRAESKNVIDMPLNKVVRLIRGKKGSTVVLTAISSLHDVPRRVDIVRDEVQLKEQEAKAEVKAVPGAEGRPVNVGIVTIPSFYADFAALKRGDPSAKRTTTDVKRLVDKMIGEDNIAGLIVDLRSNGGGSLQEAIQLTGLFIPDGPVVQVRQLVRRYQPQVGGHEWVLDVDVKEDRDRGFAYEMPLVVMVNRLSASASEIFAGAIQDYGRGVIVGDITTHGKGTVQTIRDLGGEAGRLKRLKPGALKYTMGKFYRITGASTQKRGIRPDITFPSFFDHMDLGEAQLEHVMPWDEIAPQPYSTWQDAVTPRIPALANRSEHRRQANPEFKQLAEDIARYGERRKRKTIPLQKQERLALRKEDEYWEKRRDEILSRKDGTDDDKDAQGDAEDDAKDNDIYLAETLDILRDLMTGSEREPVPVSASNARHGAATEKDRAATD